MNDNQRLAIEAKNLSVGYRNSAGKPLVVLQEFNIDIESGEFLTIIGPSGCGKSTFLRAVADLIQPYKGSLAILGGPVAEARHRRDVSFVFQDSTLLPWRTALENVLLPNEIGNRSDPEIQSKARELFELLGISGLERRYPSQLSGGQRQRVAIARALISSPKILLMDEPFGALDEITRDRLNDELLKLWKNTKTTILFVTHSIMEAAYLGQRVLVLASNPGRIHALHDLRKFKSELFSIKREDSHLVSIMADLRSELEMC